jgi:nucleoside-diphosphate-sugar epimerase
MNILVTGSSGHLGEALVRTIQYTPHQVISLDRVVSPYTKHVGSIADREFVRCCMRGADIVIHSATLHKPHIATHSRQDCIDTNITGTLNLLEEFVAARVSAFVFTSTTSTLGRALSPPPGAPVVCVTEDVRPVPRNIYGVTKTAAEDLCELFHRNHGLACVIRRTSRFFPEEDDDPVKRQAYHDENIKVNEFLYRRVDLEDVVAAHLLAVEKAPSIGFRRYIISASTPFLPDDLLELRASAPAVVRRRIPEFEEEYARRGWRMFPGIDRVYVNEQARRELGWRPRYDFRYVLHVLTSGGDFRSPLASAVGSKGFHARQFADGCYPVS